MVDTDAIASNANKKVIFKNQALFSDCIIEINNIQLDNVKDLNAVMLMYNLIEYSDIYLKTSEGLWQYYRDKLVLTDAGVIDSFPNNSTSFKFKQEMTG